MLAHWFVVLCVETKINLTIGNITASSVIMIEVKSPDSFQFAVFHFTDLSLLEFTTKNIKPISIGDGATFENFGFFTKWHQKIRVISTLCIDKKWCRWLAGTTESFWLKAPSWSLEEMVPIQTKPVFLKMANSPAKQKLPFWKSTKLQFYFPLVITSDPAETTCAQTGIKNRLSVMYDMLIHFKDYTVDLLQGRKNF